MRFYVIKERGKSAALYLFRESSFNMTRGGGGEDIEGAPKIFRHPKGGL